MVISALPSSDVGQGRCMGERLGGRAEQGPRRACTPHGEEDSGVIHGQVRTSYTKKASDKSKPLRTGPALPSLARRSVPPPRGSLPLVRSAPSLERHALSAVERLRPARRRAASCSAGTDGAVAIEPARPSLAGRRRRRCEALKLSGSSSLPRRVLRLRAALLELSGLARTFRAGPGGGASRSA